MISRVQPDIAVTVTAGDERAFFDNPYQTIATGNTNSSPAGTNFLPFVDHTSEADLVLQKQKDGKTIGTSEFHTRDMDLPGPRLIRRPGGDGDGDEDSAPARAAEPQKPVIRDPGSGARGGFDQRPGDRPRITPLISRLTIRDSEFTLIFCAA